jgi:hypothetical protein
MKGLGSGEMTMQKESPSRSHHHDSGYATTVIFGAALLVMTF